jgi:AbrB family looped-hinge helix DNA binding protein
MRTTIDRAGRVVVPKPIREHLRLLGGGELEITERGGVIEMIPVPADAEVVDSPEGPVVVAAEPLPALTDAEVQEAIDESRR